MSQVVPLQQKTSHLKSRLMRTMLMPWHFNFKKKNRTIRLVIDVDPRLPLDKVGSQTLLIIVLLAQCIEAMVDTHRLLNIA